MPDFDPDTYRSDRKDFSTREVTVIIPAGDQSRLQRAAEQARIIGESQNFTRELVNENPNRRPPTMLGERAKKMCESMGLQCETHGPGKNQGHERYGRILERRPGFRRRAAPDRHAL